MPRLFQTLVLVCGAVIAASLVVIACVALRHEQQPTAPAPIIRYDYDERWKRLPDEAVPRLMS